jgi:hypothetical protein
MIRHTNYVEDREIGKIDARSSRMRRGLVEPDPTRMKLGERPRPRNARKHDAAGGHYWRENVLHVHLQDARLTEAEWATVAAIGIRL